MHLAANAPVSINLSVQINVVHSVIILTLNMNSPLFDVCVFHSLQIAAKMACALLNFVWAVRYHVDQ